MSTRNITYGRTTIEWDKGRQGWVLPNREVTKNRHRAEYMARMIDRLTKGA